MSQSPIAVYSLPNELWTNIFMYMVKNDVAAIQQTCKNWHTLIRINYVKNQIELNTPLPATYFPTSFNVRILTPGITEYSFDFKSSYA
jgi:hypothetical protein